MPHIHDHIVIGAGIVGLASAFRLAEAGREVLILDRTGMAEGTSSGNAGGLAFPDIEPLASPGIMRKAPGWLFDPLGPLSLPLSYAPRMLPWLVQFWRASRPERYAASMKAQTALMDLAKAETRPLYAAAGIEDMIRPTGALYLYEGRRSFDASLPGWRLREAHGVPVEHVTGARIAEIQPGLAASITHASFVPEWLTVSDPYHVATGIGRAALDRGARLEIGEVVALAPREDGVTVTLGDGRELVARQVLVACGAWSHRLARLIGDRIPLETERGYNTTLPTGAFDLRVQLVLSDHGFVISPLATGVRVGGAVELAGLERPPDFRRSQAMLDKAKRFLPDLRTEGGRQWMGYRPSLPDTLPVIGRAPGAPRVTYAFGHGHLGLTQSAATARLVTDLALDRPPAIDLAPYRSDRF